MNDYTERFIELNAALLILREHIHQMGTPRFASELGAVEGKIVLAVGINTPSIKMLCEHFQIINSTMTGIIGRMEKKGIVTREFDELDRRVVLVSLTKKWRRKYQDFTRIQERSARSAYGRISQERFDSLLRLISETNECLKR